MGRINFAGMWEHSLWKMARILLGLCAATTLPLFAQTFTTFDAPGAGTGKNQGTVALGINSARTIAGIYWDASRVAHGFIRAADGTITTFDAPGVGTGKGQGTFPFSIDSAGNVAGTYTSGNSGQPVFGGSYHGFLRAANGAITTFDVPGATCGGTVPSSINTGVIVGMYWDTNCVYHVFVRATNGTISIFDAPGAGTGDSLGTAAISINSTGTVAGTYSDASNGFHGFLLAANGTITTFDAPGAGAGMGIPPSNNSVFLGTAGLSIDAAGDVAGTYTDVNLVAHGFVRSASGTTTAPIDIPGAGTAGTSVFPGTLILSINTAGDVAGAYTDANGVAHGFVRAVNGTITAPIDVPGAGTAGTSLFPGTGVSSINDLGDIAGVYSDSKGVFHGFLSLSVVNVPTFPFTVNLAGTGAGTVTSNPTGVNCPGTCGANFGAGTPVTLTATASTGSAFAGYGGACLGGTCSFALNAPTSVTATFVTNSPVLTLLAPSSAVAGSGNPVVLSVTGANFVSGASVTWNGTPLTTTFVNSSQLQATVPAADLAATGVASVAVTNPSGGGSSNPLTFDILETFGGSAGYLTMFLNGSDLGNSLLYQSGGMVGVGTTSPAALFDVEYTTAAPTNALLSNINYNNSTAVSNAVVSAFDMNFMDNSTAANLSKQTARIAYIREAGATGGVTAFDTALTTTEVVNSNAPFPVRSINIEGPNMATGTQLSFFTGLYIGSPSGSGTVVNKYALVTEPNAGNVGIGTTSPATTLEVNGIARIDSGCVENANGSQLAGSCPSDFRLKSNIQPFAPVLDKLVQLQPIHFEWDTEHHPEYHFGAGRNSGLIAQDVEKVFPELVSVDAHGYKTVNYSELPYLTLAAIRELKRENDSLRAQLARTDQNLQERSKQIEELREQIASLRGQVVRLERPKSHHQGD